jgi:hypothetical protein
LETIIQHAIASNGDRARSQKGVASDDTDVRAHASATERLLRDPDAAFALAVDQAKRAFVLGN